MNIRPLYGSDHTTLDEVTIVTAGRTAAALSPGRYPKGYPHTDPNEDCVAIADLGAHLFLAAADGHNGAEAAQQAVTAVAEEAERLDLSDPPRALADLAGTVTASVTGFLSQTASPSRTALTVVLFGAAAGHSFTFGDTWLVRLREGKGRRLNRPAPFLDANSTVSQARFHSFSVRPGDRLLAATDGLIDFLGRNALQRLANLSEPEPGAWVASAVEVAMSGGAGDNIGVAFAGL